LIRGFIARHRRAGAHEVSVAVDIVDPSHRGPVFRAFGLAVRNGGQLSGVAQAGLGEDVLECMGCVFNGLLLGSHSPERTFRYSLWIKIIARQNRSSSWSDSLSVGSIMSVPPTGKDIVGAWNP
jgi:hypothetical protein